MPALVLVAVATVLGVIHTQLLTSASPSGYPSQGFELIYWATSVATIVLARTLHYNCWHTLPARFRATSPGKAVGFLSIPFFNFYPASVSWPRLSHPL